MAESFVETNGGASELLDDALTPSRCPLCHRLFQLNGSLKPKLLPCLHTFCSQCIELQSQDERFTCPLDSQECRNVAGIMDQYFVLENLKKDKLTNGKSRDNVCEGCAADDDVATNEITASATGYCKQCADWLCESCIAAHRKVRITKEHEILSQNEYFAQIGNDCGKWQLCPLHSGQRLTMFCETCQLITCRVCQADPKHTDHSCQYLHLKASTERSVVTNLANDVMVKKDGIQKQREELEKRKASVKSLQANLMGDIEKFFHAVHQKVEIAKQDLIDRVKLKCEDVEKRAIAQMEGLCKVQNIMSYAVMFSRKSVAFEEPFPLMQSRVAVLSQLRNLMKIPSHSLTFDHTSLKFKADESRVSNWLSSLAKVIDESEEMSASAPPPPPQQPQMKIPSFPPPQNIPAAAASPLRGRGRGRMPGPSVNGPRKNAGVIMRGHRPPRGATSGARGSKTTRIVMGTPPRVSEMQSSKTPNKPIVPPSSIRSAAPAISHKKGDEKPLGAPVPNVTIPPQMSIPISSPSSSFAVRPPMGEVQSRQRSPKAVRPTLPNEVMHCRMPPTIGQVSPPQSVLYAPRMPPMTSHSNMTPPGLPNLQAMTTMPPFTMAPTVAMPPSVRQGPPPPLPPPLPVGMSKKQMDHWKVIFSKNQIDLAILPESERANMAEIYSAVQAQLAYENQLGNYLHATEMAKLQSMHPNVQSNPRTQLIGPGMLESRLIVPNANYIHHPSVGPKAVATSQGMQICNPATQAAPTSRSDYSPVSQKGTHHQHFSGNSRSLGSPPAANNIAVNSKHNDSPNATSTPNLKRKITCHKEFENSTQLASKGTPKMEFLNELDQIAGLGFSASKVSSTKKHCSVVPGAGTHSKQPNGSSSIKSDDEVFCITESCSPILSKSNSTLLENSSTQVPRHMPELAVANQPSQQDSDPSNIQNIFHMTVREEMERETIAMHTTNSIGPSDRGQLQQPSSAEQGDSDTSGDAIICLGEHKSDRRDSACPSSQQAVICAPPAKPNSDAEIAANANFNVQKLMPRGTDHLEELKIKQEEKNEMAPLHSLSPENCPLSPTFLSFSQNFLDSEFAEVNKLDSSSSKEGPCESLFECLSKIGDLRGQESVDEDNNGDDVINGDESRNNNNNDDDSGVKKGGVVDSEKEGPQRVGGEMVGPRHEEWCAVCDDGGDMILCDTCPKIYHLECHVPPLKEPPSGDFSCTLCSPLPIVSEEKINKMNRFSKMTPDDKKMCERLLLLMYCHPEGEDFYHPIPEDCEEYHLKISHPSDFKTVRKRLSRSLKNTSLPSYSKVSDFLLDLEQVFVNAITFNGVNSELGRIAKKFQSFLSSETEKIFGVQYCKLTGTRFFRRGKSLKEDIDNMSGQSSTGQ